MTQAWAVTSHLKPPSDWGFKPNPWHSRYVRVVTSLKHARELKRDLDRLEMPKEAKIHRLKSPYLII